MEKYHFAYYASWNRRFVEDYIHQKNKKARAKIHYFINILAERGVFLPGPYAKKLTRTIYELRPGVGTEEFRLFYFWHGNTAVFVHAVDRKNMRQRDIELAEKRRMTFLESIGEKR